MSNFIPKSIRRSRSDKEWKWPRERAKKLDEAMVEGLLNGIWINQKAQRLKEEAVWIESRVEKKKRPSGTLLDKTRWEPMCPQRIQVSMNWQKKFHFHSLDTPTDYAERWKHWLNRRATMWEMDSRSRTGIHQLRGHRDLLIHLILYLSTRYPYSVFIFYSLIKSTLQHLL